MLNQQDNKNQSVNNQVKFNKKMIVISLLCGILVGSLHSYRSTVSCAAMIPAVSSSSEQIDNRIITHNQIGLFSSIKENSYQNGAGFKEMMYVLLSWRETAISVYNEVITNQYQLTDSKLAALESKLMQYDALFQEMRYHESYKELVEDYEDILKLEKEWISMLQANAACRNKAKMEDLRRSIASEIDGMTAEAEDALQSNNIQYTFDGGRFYFHRSSK